MLQRYQDGGHITVLDELPEESAAFRIKESTTEVGKPAVEYPRERDHCTITRYSQVHKREHYVASDFKVFEAGISRAEHPEEAERIEALFDRVRDLPEIEEALKSCDGFAELRENAARVRRHNRLYKTVQQMWFKDTLKSYATRDVRPQEFEIEQIRHGAYRVPSLFVRAMNQRVGDALEGRDLGSYNVSWGGFLIEPDRFTAVHDLLQPFYHTADDTQ